ncbi:DNA replication/repair protein RecF [Marinicella sp. W31]|uniref:DNA replication/repair protein RecF n=1 Tax=Marinicella sp. W31 TaxID=3023713 RepID=UPI003756B6C8
MHIRKLRLTNFRILQEFSLENAQQNNLICGPNGCGKTSILEAIYLASTGKSFRNATYKHLIHHQKDSFQIYLEAQTGVDSQLFIGVHRDRKGVKQLRLNHDNCQRQAEITHQFPVVAIDTDTYQFIDRSPQSKRSYMDWMVFHVKHQYLHLWSKASGCHKHLNAFYKKKYSGDELQVWEDKFAYYAEKIQAYRQHAFELLQEQLQKLIDLFFKDSLDITLKLDKGWRHDLSMQEQLQQDKKKNMEYGLVNNGPHKMNITIRESGQMATHILSRGQKKILSVLFYLCSAEIIQQQTGFAPILCLDDIGAELDKENKHRLLKYLQDKPHQLFITAVSEDEIKDYFENMQVFHVKH